MFKNFKFLFQDTVSYLGKKKFIFSKIRNIKRSMVHIIGITVFGFGIYNRE